MIPFEWYWAVFTVMAAGAQTIRNAAQRSLTERVGTLGATYVRFLYGLPFALLIFSGVVSLLGLPPVPTPSFFMFAALGAFGQMAGTALLLAAMRRRSFVTVVAYSNTEPVQLALFGLLVLGDHLTLVVAAAVLAATLGVMLMSWPRGGVKFDLGSAVQGIVAGAFFAMAAIGFRGATQSLGGSFVLSATTALVTAMVLQSAILTLYMLVRERARLLAVLAVWRPSLLAGFMGAFASQMWFMAFALQSAAQVRTLGVVEIFFAQFVSTRIFREGFSIREAAGIGLLVSGIVLVLNS